MEELKFDNFSKVLLFSFILTKFFIFLIFKFLFSLIELRMLSSSENNVLHLDFLQNLI